MDGLCVSATLLVATQLLLAGWSVGVVLPADTEDVTCYSCVYSYHPSADTACLHNPLPEQSVRCHHSRFCTITRQWMKAEHVVRSFTRGCELKQDRQQSCTEDVYFNTCQSFCRTNLCNVGLGDLNTNSDRRRPPVFNKTSPSSSVGLPGKTRITSTREPGPRHVKPIRRPRNSSNSAKLYILNLTIIAGLFTSLYCNW